jgi:hypothetical protein
VRPAEESKNMQALILESMNTGAKSDVIDSCDFGDDSKLQVSLHISFRANFLHHVLQPAQQRFWGSLGGNRPRSETCGLRNGDELQPPTMTDAELKALRLYFALDLHDNQNTMGTFLKEFIKVSQTFPAPHLLRHTVSLCLRVPRAVLGPATCLYPG